ncbi:unnamed protein product [Brassica oleracea]
MQIIQTDTCKKGNEVVHVGHIRNRKNFQSQLIKTQTFSVRSADEASSISQTFIASLVALSFTMFATRGLDNVFVRVCGVSLLELWSFLSRALCFFTCMVVLLLKRWPSRLKLMSCGSLEDSCRSLLEDVRGQSGFYTSESGFSFCAFAVMVFRFVRGAQDLCDDEEQRSLAKEGLRVRSSCGNWRSGPWDTPEDGSDYGY